MGKAVIEQDEDGTSIKCVRGPISKMNIIVKNKTGEEFYSLIKEDLFKILPAGRSVEVFEKESLNSRRFMREYLKLVSKTDWNNIK